MGHYEIAGRLIHCHHCGGFEFEKDSILLNTPGMTMMGMAWADRTANVFACMRCGQIQWFLTEPEQIDSYES
jgi:DNA-directed RNA polymerase subunit RPC12/RpoP